jgi:hypothetical protein
MPAAYGWRLALEGRDTGAGAILTIPAKRPIKSVYIRKLMEYVKANEDGE